MSAPAFRCPNCKQSFEPKLTPDTPSAICPHCNRAMRWFYAQNNQRYGPLLLSQLRQLAETGGLLPGDWVFQEGSDHWVAAREVAELFPQRASVPPPMPAPQSRAPASGARASGSARRQPGRPSGPPVLRELWAVPVAMAVLPFRRPRPTGTIVRATLGYTFVATALLVLALIFLPDWSGNSRPQPNPQQAANGQPEQPGQPVQPVNQGPEKKPGWLTGPEAYQKTLPSTVWIKFHKSSGTGSLVDFTNRLVITNAHVVPEEAPATIHFPRYENGGVVAEKEYYDRFPKDAVSGIIVYKDTQRDLAILKLDSLPPGAKAVPLGKHSAAPGETIHAIGNPGASGALWVYSSGTVRQVYQKRWTSTSQNGGPVYNLLAHVLETQVPANPGDSGGPVVNSYGELVGVTQGFSQGAQLFSNAIDITEVHYVLDAYKKSNTVAGAPGK